MPDRSLILVSGGPDSTTLVKWARANGHEDIHHLYYRTGHVHDIPAIQSADTISNEVGAPLEILDIEHLIRGLGATEILIHSEASIMPFGNAIALSIAVAYAKKIHANKVLIGIHADDAAESKEYCRPFLDSIQTLAQSTLGDIEIMTPFIDMTKSEVFTQGAELGVDFSKTWSCIRTGDLHYGYCGTCRARARAFVTIGQEDATVYGRPVVALQSAGSH
jgi:7-cyano-7-deazaguanine synthase